MPNVLAISNRRRTYKNSRKQAGGDIQSGRKTGPKSQVSTTSQSGTTFSTPSDIEDWFKIDSNFFKFIYGLGNFLKFKESAIEDRLKNISDEIVKLDEDFKLSIENYLSILGERDDDDKGMKSVLQEKLQEQLSAGYETKYNELVNKKQSYQMILRFLQNRRAYIVYELQKDGGKKIKDNIQKRANVIYTYYRGYKYKLIREKIYNLINVIAFTPSALKNSFTLNSVITGPAGSGKTTIAREIARWYSVIGILTYDSFNENDEIAFSETGRANFIGEYTGQTAPKTIGVLYQSLEKTLFMDEAYSIAGCNFDRQTGALEPDAYGEEFIAELLRFMNDHKAMNAIIIAGYKNLMQKCFMERNEGLPRRFPTIFDLPLASTDELFNIFLKNTVDKSLDNISNVITELKKKQSEDASDPGIKGQITAKEEQKEKLKNDKVKFYTVMKPSFMMLHFDTTYSAIETLRKYLISIQYRINMSGETGISLDKIYSYSITSHILVCLLDSDVRKNLMRRQFYREVFQNEDVNLSFFKAQAGEMSLISDLCSKTIEPMIMPGDVVVSACDEMNLLNTYFEPKNIKIDIYESCAPSPPVSTPAVRTPPGAPGAKADAATAKAGPATAKAGGARVGDKYYLEVLRGDAKLYDFQGIINSFLDLENLFDNLEVGGLLPDSSTPKVETGPQESPLVRLAKEEAKELVPEIFQMKMIEKAIQSVDPITAPLGPIAQRANAAAADARSAAANAASAAAGMGPAAAAAAAPAARPAAPQSKSPLELAYDNAVLTAQEIAKLSIGIEPQTSSTPPRKPEELPSLLKLYKMLFNERLAKLLNEHVVNMYLKKNSLKYVNDLLKRIETDFPVHLQRPELEGEQTILAGSDARTAILTDANAYYAASMNEGRSPDSFENVRQKELGKNGVVEETTKYKTIVSDILWEDFGFY